MSDTTFYLELIRQSHPHIKVDQAIVIESGDHSFAIAVNDDYIFRFPRKKEFYGEYVAEKELLDTLRPQLSWAVPALKLYEVSGQLFTCHRMIKGIQYSHLTKITPALKKRLAQEIAHFLVQLHCIKCDDRPYQPFLLKDEGIDRIDQVLADYLKTPVKCQAAQKTIDEFHQLHNRISVENPVMCHNDLNENNFLVSEGHVTGIIDFGNAMRRDYSTEFAALLKYDCEFVKLMAYFYENETRQLVDLNYALTVQKLRIYNGMKECLVHNDQDRLKRYNKWLNYLEQNEHYIKG